MFDGRFVLECLVMHDKFTKVLVLVLNLIGAVQNRALFESMVIQRWFVVDDLANQTWFIDGFIWVAALQACCTLLLSGVKLSSG